MHVSLDDPRFVPDLVEFLGRARVVARAGRSGRVLLEDPDNAAGRRRLELIVTGWEALHPRAGVRFVDARPRARRDRRVRPLDAV